MSSETLQTLSIQERAGIMETLLATRLETVLPEVMRESGLDLWLLICREDNLDPAYKTFLPLNTWCPILQILALFDTGKEIRRYNIAATDTHALYEKPYSGRLEEEQWQCLCTLIERHDPKRIGINVSSTQWAADGLTHSLHQELIRRLPEGVADRCVSSETLAQGWLTKLTAADIEVYEDVVRLGRRLIRKCFSREVISPGTTTTTDLEWFYYQECADLGIEPSFKPYFNLRRPAGKRTQRGEGDEVIRPGDTIHCDVGVRYLGFNTDHQEWCYILQEGETDAPAGLRELMAEGNRLQDIFMAELKVGITGNELLSVILGRAGNENLPNPKIYSHSLGYFLHEPGPLIGLPWEQERNPGRGDVPLQYDSAFAMELSVEDKVSEWDEESVALSIEQDVIFTREGCRPLDGRQTSFHLISP